MQYKIKFLIKNAHFLKNNFMINIFSWHLHHFVQYTQSF